MIGVGVFVEDAYGLLGKYRFVAGVRDSDETLALVKAGAITGIRARQHRWRVARIRTPSGSRDLWDTRHVKSALATGGMPEAKVFLYFLAITTFDWLQFTAFRIWPNPEPLSLPAEFEAWFGLGITVAGVVFLFLCNGGGQGKDFLYRYFPLAVMGVLLTMHARTRAMRAQAATAGHYHSPWGKHPKLQILTVEQLLAGQGVDYPPARQASVL